MSQAKEILYKIGNTPEFKPLKEYFEQMEIDCADIRKIQDKSPESLKGHEIACEIIREKILKPMMKIAESKTDTDHYH